MAKAGKQTGTSASAELLAADAYRGHVTIMLLNAISVGVGLEGATALADTGVILIEVGDTLELHGEMARGQVNVIGNTALLTWQEGPIVVRRRGYLA